MFQYATKQKVTDCYWKDMYIIFDGYCNSDKGLSIYK